MPPSLVSSYLLSKLYRAQDRQAGSGLALLLCGRRWGTGRFSKCMLSAEHALLPPLPIPAHGVFSTQRLITVHRDLGLKLALSLLVKHLLTRCIIRHCPPPPSDRSVKSWAASSSAAENEEGLPILVRGPRWRGHERGRCQSRDCDGRQCLVAGQWLGGQPPQVRRDQKPRSSVPQGYDQSTGVRVTKSELSRRLKSPDF